MQGHLTVAAHVILYVNGKIFGQVTSFSYSVDQPFKENRGIDSNTPYELAPIAAKVTFSMQVVKTIGDGGIESKGMSAPFEDLPNQKYFSVLLVDRRTDTKIFQSDNCMTSSQSWSFPAKSLAIGSINAQGILWNNELTAVHTK